MKVEINSFVEKYLAENAYFVFGNVSDVQSSIAKFYGVKEKELDNDSDDLASVVKRRRVMAAEKAQKERVLRSEEKKLEEEDRRRYEQEQFEKEFQVGGLV